MLLSSFLINKGLLMLKKPRDTDPIQALLNQVFTWDLIQ